MLEKLADLFRRKTAAQKLEEQINGEIYGRLFPHLNNDQNHGYPFANDRELVAHSETLDIHAALEEVEKQIDELPPAYGRCFRFAIRRDMCEKLRAYKALADRRTEPNVYWQPTLAKA